MDSLSPPRKFYEFADNTQAYHKTTHQQSFPKCQLQHPTVELGNVGEKTSHLRINELY